MIPNVISQALRTVYCGHCHLSTLASTPRCLHCGKPIGPNDQQTPRAGAPVSVAKPNHPGKSASH